MKWGFEILLAILFILAFLLVGKQLLKEPFADVPTPEVYDIQLFFKAIPFSEICSLWLSILPKVNQSFQADEKGMTLPQDVVQQKTNQFLQTQIPTGPLACPVSFPDTNDLQTIHSFVLKLNDRFLEQAHRTLLFCAVEAQKELTNSKNALAQKKKPVEGFLTECSPEEILLKNIVPLQCIDPAVMKATEKQIIDKDPNAKENQKLKKEIAQKLAKLQTIYIAYLENAKQFWNQTLSNSRIALATTEKSIDTLKEKNDDSDEASQKLQNLMEQKQGLNSAVQTATYYTSFLPLSYEKIIEMTKKNLAETKQIQNDIQSGKISFT